MSNAFISVIDISADFPGPAVDAPIAKDDIVEEDAPWDVTGSITKDDRRPSALHLV